MTDAQCRALTILAAQSELMAAGTFADRMWPTNHRKSNQGAGLAGGGYLGKLSKLGLVTWDSGGARSLRWGWKITAAGRAALQANEGDR